MCNNSFLWSQEFDTFLSDFQIFDVDGDGHLEKDEMILLFQAQLNREPSKKEVRFLIDEPAREEAGAQRQGG